ncbi:snRNA-activating protein complex subunit 2 isoform X2 [Arapaima gigas]
MKPPKRQRTAPQRFITKQTEQRRQPRVRSLWSSWSATERRHLLAGLRKQASRTEVDLDALKKKLPKRSLQEIFSFLDFLKGRVRRCVVHQVQSWRREERRQTVPIQLWSELAKNMVGSLEETISSAFSQILVIGATEPCSLLHSDPPHHISMQELTQCGLRTIFPKPTIAFTSTPSIRPRTVGNAKGVETPPTDQLQGTVGMASPPRVTSSMPQSSSTPLSSGPSRESESEISSRPAHVKHLPANPNHSNMIPCSSAQPDPPLQLTTSSGLGGPAQDTSNGQLSSSVRHTLQKPVKDKHYIVNFENIYQFLNAANKKGKEPILTPMESAVLLDLLLSLPEELRLLDCETLQHHMCQVHMRLTATAEVPRMKGKHGPCSLSPSTERETPSSTKLPKEALSTSVGIGKTDISEDAGAQGRSKHLLGDGDAGRVLERPINVEVGGSDGSVGFSQANQSDRNVELSSSEPLATCAVNDSRSDGCNKTTATQNPSDAESSTAAPSQGLAAEEKADWSTVGLCPLNPFMIPLKLLTRSAGIPEGEDDSQPTCQAESATVPE